MLGAGETVSHKLLDGQQLGNDINACHNKVILLDVNIPILQSFQRWGTEKNLKVILLKILKIWKILKNLKILKILKF